MAVAPLFVPSMSALKAALRLSGVVDGDTQAILEAEVVSVRVEFYTELSAERVAEILTTAHSDTPSSPEQLLRASAEELEVKLTLLRLRTRLPQSFLDSSASVGRTWNEAPEAPGISGVDRDAIFLRSEIARLWRVVEATEDGASGNSGILADTIEADDPPDLLGRSRFPGGKYPS